MKKTLRKIIPAIAMLLISATLVGTSTFAWFSMNSKVTVTGMTVSTKIGDSLQIAKDEIGSTAKKADANFSNGLNQEVKAKLEPVSTIDGETFYYTSTSNVKADGDAIKETYTAYNEGTALANAAAGKANQDPAFNTNYGVTTPTTETVVYGYVDYVFQLKAINTDSVNDKELRMTKVNLLYNDTTATDQIKSFRVAVFAEDITSSDPTAGVGGLVSILKYTSGAYRSTVSYNVKNDAVGTTSGTDGLFEYIDGELYGNNADPTAATKWYTTDSLATANDVTSFVKVTAEATAKATGQNLAVDSTATLGSVSNLGTDVVLATVDESSTKYYKVVVRLWLEGEDVYNNNANFLTLTKDWTLDLAIELTNDTDAAVAITSAANAVATPSGDTGTITLSDGKLSNGEIPATYAWKNAADGSAAAGTNNAATYTASADGDFYCLITTTKGSVYKTNTITLDAA